MKLKSIVMAAAVAAGTFACAAQATPLVWTVSEHGKIVYGTDYEGLFGNAGASIVGLEYTQTITASVDSADYLTNWAAPDYLFRVQPNGSISFTVTTTINGSTVTLNPTSAFDGDQVISDAVSTKSNNYDYDLVETINKGYGLNGVVVTAGNQIISDKYNGSTGFVPAADFNRSFTGGVDFKNISGTSWLYVNDANNVSLFSAIGYADSFAVNAGDASANVPEPASIALLGLGFAGMSVLRRRKAS